MINSINMAQPNYELDQQTAELRSSIISDVTYNLLLNLQKGDEFVGASTATFNLSDNTKEL